MPHQSRTPAEAVERYRGRVVEYEGRELVAYHWHPRGNSPVTRPHMHVGIDVRVGDRWLGKVHLPTGAIGLADIVALTISDLGVEPLREDWERVLREDRS